MPITPPNFTALEWRQLALACKTVAERERSRAAEAGEPAARGFQISAETFERLAEQCMEMTRPPG